MPYIIDNTPFKCRFCSTVIEHTMVDLGVSPLCEDFLTAEELHEPETFYPLEALVCHECWLVQVPDYAPNTDIFDNDYGYFSSYSTSWMAHAKRYVDMATERFSLNKDSFVVEVASNDGYLLRNFVERGIPCLGIDPAANVAEAAIKIGVPTQVEFFTDELAKGLVENKRSADLVIGNNVLAHTPYVTDFIQAVATLMKPDAHATFEFPHLLKLLEQVQFDTIYHEHFSYYSLYTVRKMFRSVGLELVDVEEINTAGGSLRVYLQHSALGVKPSASVARILEQEKNAGLQTLSTYHAFAERVTEVKYALLNTLIRLKLEGKTVVGYGAAGKGNTLLNYCGIKPDLLSYVVDRSVHKHGRFLPGTHIPIYAPEKIAETKPDYILILPWNLQTEITEQLSYVKEWGAQFIIPIPTATILD